MDLLKKKWVIVNTELEDKTIVTEDGQEVLGCSEWLRCDDEVLDHIITVHNKSIQL